MMKLTMTEQTENITFFIIDGLDEAGFLRTDFLDSHKARINYEDQSVELTFEGHEDTISTNRTKWNNPG